MIRRIGRAFQRCDYCGHRLCPAHTRWGKASHMASLQKKHVGLWS